MIRIAVQSKGRLADDTMNLLAESDIKINAKRRILLVQSSNFPLEVLYLRDDDIPQSVATGVADLGIVGENEYVERGGGAEIVSRPGSVNAACRWLYQRLRNTTAKSGLTARQ